MSMAQAIEQSSQLRSREQIEHERRKSLRNRQLHAALVRGIQLCTFGGIKYGRVSGVHAVQAKCANHLHGSGRQKWSGELDCGERRRGKLVEGGMVREWLALLDEG